MVKAPTPSGASDGKRLREIDTPESAAITSFQRRGGWFDSSVDGSEQFQSKPCHMPVASPALAAWDKVKDKLVPGWVRVQARDYEGFVVRFSSRWATRRRLPARF